ncbi:MAG: sigma-70 family RNA polymerase sigma factor [Pirellulaceae bacterium]
MSESGNERDPQRLTRLFRELELPLVAYATSLTGNREQARDVVQDAFMRLCDARNNVSPGSERAWLYRVCRNRSIDIQKKEGRMKNIDQAAASEIGSTDHDPSTASEIADCAEQAQALLSSLPDNQREVIRLKVQGGLSYQEISDLTGLSVSNVGYLLHTGLKTIRNRMTLGNPTDRNTSQQTNRQTLPK